ncbi:MAG: branched-chain amino acid aminotransferase [Gemmatimonadota bacterium]|nr:branched-chain amino acid aminotransferase [Gemmatimonadota bacterium]
MSDTALAPVPTTRVETSRRNEVDFEELPFGSVFADHMYVARYADGAWREREIRPYGPILLHPSCRGLQYGLSLFEGFKVHRTPDGRAVAFRPDQNYERLNMTAARLAMPSVPRDMFFEALQGLIDLDREWIPDASQGSLYIRPTYFCTNANLNVQPGTDFLFIVMTGPFGPYFTGGELALTTTRKYVRAFPGGTGDVKPAGNYAGSLLATREAQDEGYQNVLWLDGIEHRYIEECGVMNVFFVIDGVAVTPPLEGTILRGVTRKSIIQLMEDRGIRCEVRRVSVDELLDAADAGTLDEAFGAGTAATVAPIHRLGLEGRDVRLEDRPDSVANRIKTELQGIQMGRIEDRHGWLHEL